MSWHHKYIDDPIAAFRESKQFMGAIEAATLHAPLMDIALYSKLDLSTGGINYYFTPAAEQIAKAFFATPCEKPSRVNIGSLLVGDQTLILRLYP